MVFLHHKGDMVSSEVLAENICTTRPGAQVMPRLNGRGGWKRTEGAVGGYRFAGSADTVTLCDIAQAVGARSFRHRGAAATWISPVLWQAAWAH